MSVRHFVLNLLSIPRADFIACTRCRCSEIGKCRACSEIGVFWEEVLEQARKGAGRNGKRIGLISPVGLFFVLIEENLEVAAHVGFVEGVFHLG